MTDDTDDLDEFARMFGAKPETPPEGLIPPAEAKPAPSAEPTAPTTALPARTPATAPISGTGDPLGWLLTPPQDAATAAVTPQEPPTALYPGAALPPASAAFDAASAFPVVAPPAEPTQALPTRRSAAAAASSATDNGRRNLIILASVGALVLVLLVVLVIVLVVKAGGSGTATPVTTPSDTATPSRSATPSSTPTPTPTATPTPTPTPTPTTTHTAAPPPPIQPALTNVKVASQPACPPDATQVTFTIIYTNTNTNDLTLTSPDGTQSSLPANVTAQTSAPISYDCTHPGGSYGLKAIGSDGTDPATATVTPAPTAG